MTFLHPILFLAGVVSIAIPILIHLLLRQRRRPIMWGAMRFLIEAYRRQRQRLRLEQWLLLATRCLLVALLGAALARPLLSSAGLLTGPAGRSVYLLIDNGLASSIRDLKGDSSALDRHKQQAAAVLAGLGPADRAGLVLLGAPAQPVVLPASSDVAAVRRLLDAVESTDAATDLAGAFEGVAASLDSDDAERARPVTLVLISDFLLGSADPTRPLGGSLAGRDNVRILASRPRDAASTPTQVQVIAVEPLRPVLLTGGAARAGEREQVRVSLRRTGPGISEPGTSTVRVRIASGADGAPSAAPPAQASVRWQPGQSEATVTAQVSLPPATGDAGPAALLTAEIDRDALASDNMFRRPVRVREALRVGVIARSRFGAGVALDRLAPADWYRLALRPTPGTPIDLVDIEPASVDASALASVDAVVVPAPDLVRDEDWGRLRRFADTGGFVLVSPSADASVHLWSDAMVRAMGVGWRLAREPRVFDEPTTLDEPPARAPLLALIAAELPSLVRPVTVRRVLDIEQAGPRDEILLTLKDRSPWLLASEPGSSAAEDADSGSARGLLVYLASAPALAWTDLPAKPLMVPLLQELSRQGFGRAAGASTSVAGRPVAAPALSAELHLVAGDGASSQAPLVVGAEGVTEAPARRAGLWQARDDAGRPRGLIAINPDPDAGRTQPQDPSVIRSWLAGSFGAGTEVESGASGGRVAWLDATGGAADLSPQRAESPFALPMLIAVLVLALAEMVMARYFSHAFAPSGGRAALQAVSA